MRRRQRFEGVTAWEWPHLRESITELQRCAAEKRAHEVLLEHLTPRQRRKWKNGDGYIPVWGSAGGRYRIYSGRAYNVFRTVWGVRVEKICAAAGNDPYEFYSSLPHDDHILVQMLMLQADEDGFLAKANRRSNY